MKPRFLNFSNNPHSPQNSVSRNSITVSRKTLCIFVTLYESEISETKIGCYCSVNNTLKRVIDILSKNYEVVLIDAPAGLEYFARKTGRDVTDLVIVSDPSKMGIHTMKRILEVTKEVDLLFENIWILGNRFPESIREILENEIVKINEKNVIFLGLVPNDEEISKINLIGENLLQVSNESIAYKRSKELFAKII